MFRCPDGPLLENQIRWVSYPNSAQTSWPLTTRRSKLVLVDCHQKDAVNQPKLQNFVQMIQSQILLDVKVKNYGSVYTQMSFSNCQ